MAQTGYTPIQLYYSSTTTNVPLAANLAAGELAINTADGKLFYKDSGGTVQVLATKGTGAIGGSNGQVQFNNSGVLGGSANLFWDNTNAYLGIGTNSPQYQLDVRNASGASTITIRGGTPSSIQGDGLLSLQAQNATGSGVSYGNIGVTQDAAGNTTAAAMYFTTRNSAGTNAERMRIDSSGNVGIGTSSPTYKLQMSGGNVAFSNTAGNVCNVEIAGNGNTPGTNSFVIQQATTSDTLLWNRANANLTFGTNATERMRIDTSGNLLINTTTPVAGSAYLYIKGGVARDAINVAADTTGTAYFASFRTSAGTALGGFASDSTQTNFNIAAYGASSPLTFSTNSTERMRIDSSGRTAISTSSNGVTIDGYAALKVENGLGAATGTPWENSTLTVKGDAAMAQGVGGVISFEGNYITSNSASSNFAWIKGAKTNSTSGNSVGDLILGARGGSIRFSLDTANSGLNTESARITTSGGFSVGTTADPGAGAIYATGNITAYYSSDARLKENIKDVDNALDIVCAIGSKTFDWTDEYIASKGGEDGYFVQKSDFGVVAQDVQEVFPQAVRKREDGTLAVDYEKLATLSFGAIKQLLARVEALESK